MPVHCLLPRGTRGRQQHQRHGNGARRLEELLGDGWLSSLSKTKRNVTEWNGIEHSRCRIGTERDETTQQNKINSIQFNTVCSRCVCRRRNQIKPNQTINDDATRCDAMRCASVLEDTCGHAYVGYPMKGTTSMDSVVIFGWLATDHEPNQIKPNHLLYPSTDCHSTS
mmetsp:Transcript_27151/g.74460  ORF Transcript_27151/g.74460 Transcript_27151/m.74460 type:complete len:168 (-) Transcript_27151:284-787(-)